MAGAHGSREVAGLMDRILGADVGQPLTQPPQRGVCNRKGVVLDFHVWNEPRLRCQRCGFDRTPIAEPAG